MIGGGLDSLACAFVVVLNVTGDKVLKISFKRYTDSSLVESQRKDIYVLYTIIYTEHYVFIQIEILNDKHIYYIHYLDMSQEPSDNFIEQTILEQLLTLDTNVKPNKLRKIVCKIVSSTNWTQFQRVLDKLIETGKVKLSGEEQGDKVLILPTDKNDKKKSQKNDEPCSQALNDTIEVPVEIVSNLLRKGKKKQKNIEINTKTKLKFDKDVLLAVRKSDFGTKQNTIITISSEILDDIEIAKKHVKAAKLMIHKMVQAYKENPDHYMRKAGGTFAEQDEAKKRKADALQKLQQKKKNVIAEDEGVIQTKHSRKKRKFY